MFRVSVVDPTNSIDRSCQSFAYTTPSSIVITVDRRDPSMCRSIPNDFLLSNSRRSDKRLRASSHDGRRHAAI
jgi:hypothetical protein